MRSHDVGDLEARSGLGRHGDCRGSAEWLRGGGTEKIEGAPDATDVVETHVGVHLGGT
jgi:hypothetical protein